MTRERPGEGPTLEIGYTWYAARWQRSHVNTACKLLLLTHALERAGCRVVGLRTDNFTFASQRAIEALGARKDGVSRRGGARRAHAPGRRVFRHRGMPHLQEDAWCVPRVRRGVP